MTVHFTLDGTRKEAWPFVKDFNAWQNSEGYYYDSVIGDQEGGSFRLSTDPNDFEGSPSYDVIKVIPEYVIVVSQPIPEGAYGGKDWSIGQGGVSAGFHIVGLDQFGDKTIVTFHMEHASLVGNEGEDVTESWRPMTEEAARKWREGLIPNMKRLVAEARRNA